MEWDEGSFVLHVRQEQGQSSIQICLTLTMSVLTELEKTLAVTTHSRPPRPRLVLSHAGQHRVLSRDLFTPAPKVGSQDTH